MAAVVDQYRILSVEPEYVQREIPRQVEEWFRREDGDDGTPDAAPQH